MTELGLAVPPHVAAERKAAQEQQAVEDLEKQIPKPVGYHLLIALPQVEDAFEGTDLLKPEQIKRHDRLLSIFGAVIDMGDQAYSDSERFPNGPWCQVGDYVMFRPNSGTRFQIGRVEYRLINDDTVEAVVPDPSGIQRV